MSLFKPKTQEQVSVNIVYMAASVVCYVLAFFIKHSKRHQHRVMDTIFGINAYLAFRQAVRVFDFEHTVPKYDDIDDWHFLVLIQMLGAMTTIIVMFNCFEENRTRNFIGYGLIMFVISSMVVGTYGRERFFKELEDSVLTFIFALAIWTFIIRVFQKVNSELIDNLQSKIEQKT